MASGNILVVDDEQLVLMNYSDLLGEAGYAVATASSFVQGMNLVMARDFDLVICDHDLPDGKGLDIIKSLSARGKDTPVIYLSAALPSILAEASSLANIKAVLSKPVESEALVEAARTFVKSPDAGGFPRLIGDEERNMLLGMEEDTE